MAAVFVKTFKRDCVHVADLPGPETVLAKLAAWFDDYNEHQPKAGQSSRLTVQYSEQKPTSRLSSEGASTDRLPPPCDHRRACGATARLSSPRPGLRTIVTLTLV